MDKTEKAKTKCRFTWEGETLIVTSPDGDETFEFDTSQYPDEVKPDLYKNGVKQKLCDTTAGKGQTFQDKIDLMQATHERLLAGEYNSTERAGRESFTEKQLLEMAAAEGVSEEEQAMMQSILAKVKAAKEAAKQK